MDVRRRATGSLLVVGGVAIPVAAVYAVTSASPAKAVPWLLASAVFFAGAVVVWRRMPAHPMTFWFALTASTFLVLQTAEGAMGPAPGTGPGDVSLAWIVLLHQSITIVGSVAAAHLLGLFPDGRARRPVERHVLSRLWWLLLLPPLVLVGRPLLLFPAYVPAADVASPYHVAALPPVGTVAAFGVTAAQSAFALGVVLLVLRYRRTDAAERRRIRWLLVPAVFASFAVATDLLTWTFSPDGAYREPAQLLFGMLWIAVLVALPVVIAIALLRPGVFDVDLVIRRSLVYGVLWGLIALTYVAAAAGLGLAAGQRFPVEGAIVLTVAATLLFQPARRWLERVADRRVFGERLGAYEALRQLGRTLEEGFALPDLLPRLADTVRRGLGLAWVRVVVEDDGRDTTEPDGVAGDLAGGPATPTVVVPVVDDGETVGRIEGGVAAGRELSEQDHELLQEVARQAGVAMRTLRLTRALRDSVTTLGRRTEELEESRSRLFRVQAAERRRLERDLHDGVQQDVVALIGRVGISRRQLERDPDVAAPALAEVQDELGRILGLLRELAHGIHPTVLSDRGLFEALEAQAARSPLPVTVHGDHRVRSERYREELEGAAYFTVSEALANVLKHARARSAEVRVARWNGTLQVAVRDDGCGFDARTVRGEGLSNLAERLASVGGRLVVVSQPGGGTTVTAEIAMEPNGHAG